MLSSAYFEFKSLSALAPDGQISLQKETRYFFELNWFRKGSGRLQIDSTNYTILPNTIVCLVPGQYSVLQMEEDTMGYCIRFSRDFLFKASSNPRILVWLDGHSSGDALPVMNADNELQSEMNTVLLQMEKEYRNNSLLKAELLSGLLNILLIHCSRKWELKETELAINRETELVRQFKQLLNSQFTTKKMVSDYASVLCVTPNYLNRTVKKVTGFTASYHIQQFIIMEAKRKAMQSSTTMKEIAYFLGFDNLAHFSKFFKNNCGISFSTFKKELNYTN